jgi:transmembrane sensor
MNIADQEPGQGDALEREAAHWFARMRAPNADSSRGAFDAWLAQRPEHRSAYNRAAEIFALGKLLAEPDVPAPAPQRRKLPVAALTVIAAGILGLGGWALWQPAGMPPDRGETVVATTIDTRTIATVAGETRVVRLADGSTVQLVGDTALLIDIAASRRDLKLLRGTARFEVAHESRPFVVLAGGGSVTARGTIFEVALTLSGKVDVRLLQGAIDVALPRRQPSSPPPIRKLAAGESVSFAGAAEPATGPATTTRAPAAAATAIARDFEATPVADLIALANRGATRPIRLADPTLGARRVSGRFRVDDTALLAHRLGALFDRRVDTDDPRAIVLGPAAGLTDADASDAPQAQPVSKGTD